MNMFSENNLLIIELASKNIKFVYADAKTAAVHKILIHELTDTSQDAIASAIADNIKKNSLTFSRCVAVISRREITVRILSLPSVNDEELKQMASFEALKQIPFQPDEIYYDYRVMEKTSDGYSRIVLSIAHKNVVNKIIDIFKKINIFPDMITVTTEGLYNWADVAVGQLMKANQPFLLLNIDNNKIEFEILNGANILLSRASSFGAESLLITGPEQAVYKERLMVELKRSLNIFAKESLTESAVNQVIITGSKNASDTIISDIESQLNLRADFKSQQDHFSSEPDAFGMLNEEANLSLASALGSVFAFEKNCLNMLPPVYKRKQAFLKKSKKTITVSLMLSFIVIMIFSLIAIKIYQKNKLLTYMTGSVKKISPITEKLEAKVTKLAAMREHMEKAKKPLTFLYELHRVIPSAVLLNYLSFNNDKIILQGTTPAMSTVFEFVNKLEKSDKFSNVKTNYVSKRRLNEKETVDFQISCDLILGK